MKNANGSGSVYKLNDKKRRKQWVARVTIGYSIDGRQLRKTLGTFEKKIQAQEALFNYNKNPLLFSDKTFGEIKELWWESYIKGKSKNTIMANQVRAKKLEPLNDLKINKIKLFTLQKLFDELDISYNFKKDVKSMLNLIFDFAVKNEFLNENKVSYIEIGEKKAVVKRRIFSKKEIDILWENVNSKKNSLIYTILILIYTGLRISELLNLKNSDIDFKNKLFSIRNSKTNSGIRTIPIPDKIIHLFVDNFKPEQNYFIEKNKNSMLYPTYSKKFSNILKELKIEKHTIHDTRHTFATLLNNAEANATSIIKLIGHSDFTTTQNVYSHKDVEELRKAINLLN